MQIRLFRHPMDFKLVDQITFIYILVVSFLVAFFHAEVGDWGAYLGYHALYLLVILALIWAEAVLPENRVIKFLRFMYPLFTLGLVYKSIEGYVLILHGHFLDPLINQSEKAVFGQYPSLWLEKFVSRPLTEFFFMNYFAYYFYFVVPALILFIQRRYLDLERFLFNLMTAFYVAYLGFVLFPVEGPIFVFKNLFTIPQLEGYIFVPLQNFLMAHGDPHGACYPSSHVAVCWVSMFSIRQAFGSKPFWRIFPFAICLTIAVVYNRFHYLSDAVAGLATAWVCLAISQWIFKTSLSRQAQAEI